MGQTDNPLKQLVTAFITDFASWLLGAEVREATARTTALPTSPDSVLPDQVFHVTLADGREVVLHIEFQGRSSHKPMPLRMLDYLARLTDVYRDTPLSSVVFYVGTGAGQADTGRHQALALDGRPSLSWQYQVIRLWELEAADLLALGRPALLALVGQTRITEPEVVLPQVIDTFKTVPDREQQYRLLTAFIALMSEKELFPMIEKLIEQDDLFADMPYLQRIQEKYHEGVLATRRNDILKILQLRFSLPVEHLRPISIALDQVAAEEHLDTLLQAAVQSESLAAFQAVLDEQRQQQEPEPSDNGNGTA